METSRVTERLQSIHDLPAVERFRREMRIDPHAIKRFRHACFKSHLGVAAAARELPSASRTAFLEQFQQSSLSLVQRHDSEDGASKLLFQRSDGKQLESVILRISQKRTSLCVSSQVGCAVRCSFCGTGTLPVVANLSTPEILDQLMWANQLVRDEGRRIRNVVFMGMGEPLHNEAAVYPALRQMHNDGGGFGLSARRTTLSTVGIPAALSRCADLFPELALAISLHSAVPATRALLVPTARVGDLSTLQRTLHDVHRRHQRTLLIEYIMLEGVNDSPAEAEAAIEFLRGLRVHINLIPFNPITFAMSGAYLRGSDSATRRRFADILRSAGHPVTIRNSLGQDVKAACGQLACEQLNNPG